MNRFLAALLLTVVTLPAYAGAKLPAWLRVVDHDGQVLDVPGIGLNSITLCPSTGDADIWSQGNGAGTAIVQTAWGELRLRYETKFYNQGAATGNPNTTGDQVVLIETVDGLFASGFDNCETHGG